MTTFTNSTGITIADVATEHQTLAVAGLWGTITSVSVTLTGLSHTWPDDLDFLLVGPNSTANLEFWSDAGASLDLSNATVTVANSGASGLPDTTAIFSGTTYKPADYELTGETAANWFGLANIAINHPASAGSATFASAFGGLVANGNWSLWVRDNSGGDRGTLTSWSLNITTLDHAPVITSNGGGDTATVAVPENTTAVVTVTASDIDPDGFALSYSIIGGADQASFQINSTTGALSFVSAPDFETPTNSDHNNSYVVQVQVSDGALTDIQTITVNVTNDFNELTGGNGNDLNYGGAGDDVMTGGGGDDVLVTGDGNDFAYGGPGNDYLYMGNGDDTAVGDAGDDVLLGEAGNDALFGGDGQDYLFGGSGTNTMYGGVGVDVLISQGVNDVMFGGADGDYIYAYGGGPTTGFGDDGNDIYVGSNGIDTFYGGNGQDYFYGQDGNDVAYGGAGVDVLLGQDGNDTLVGGGGAADYLFGGADADTFVVQNLPGANVIMDFARFEGDVIRLQDTGLNSFADVLSHTSDFGSFCVVTISVSENIWVIGQTSATLQTTDFAFS